MAAFKKRGLIARKIGMTRIVDQNGNMIPVTLLQVEDQKVTKVLTEDRDGYNAIQVGYNAKKEKHLTKPDIQRLRKVDISENYAKFQEFRLAEASDDLVLGTALTLEMFSDVERVDVSGLTKGRGFQGSVKRWNTAIGRMTHGSRFHRRPGSLGQCTTPGRVYKNKKMPGHHGDAQRTVKNLKVVNINAENRVIAIKGSVPGYRTGFIEIRPTNKG